MPMKVLTKIEIQGVCVCVFEEGQGVEWALQL